MRLSDMAAYTPPSVTGIRINCVGDQKIRGAIFVSVEILETDPILGASTPELTAVTSPMSILVGMPSRLRKYEPNPVWKKSIKPGLYENKVATFLMAKLNSDKQVFEDAPEEWRQMVGSVLMVRADGKDLKIEHLEALIQFVHPHVPQAGVIEAAGFDQLDDETLKLGEQQTVTANADLDQLDDETLMPGEQQAETMNADLDQLDEETLKPGKQQAVTANAGADDKTSEVKKVNVLDILTQIGLRNFFLAYRIEKIKHDIDWVGVMAPV